MPAQQLPDQRKPTMRILNLVLSDLHFGSDISKEETGSLDYGKIEEAARIAHVAKETIGYANAGESELEVWLIGDIFQNSLHDARDGAVLAEQMARSMHLLGQVFALFAANFKQVRVHCAVGNHGRFTSRHKGRAVHGKYDSAETVVYYALRMACAHLSNVKFTIPKTPFVTGQVFDRKVFATHGDSVISPGNPGKSIQISSLENQTNRLNAHLTDSSEYSIFLCGHVHTASMTYLPNGGAVITNGALVPSDPFAIALGIPETQCGQWLWESVEGDPIRSARLIRVGPEQDSDKSLLELIKPWVDF